MTREEIEKRSRELGVIDIRYSHGYCMLEDYESALKSMEEIHKIFTKELLDQAKAAGSKGLSFNI